MATESVWLDLTDQPISVSSVTNYFNEWFALDEGVTFEVLYDTTDDLGTQHIAYQQYWNGTLVEHHMLIVHAKDGQVTHINGDLMTSALSSNVRKAISNALPCQSQNNDVLIIYHEEKGYRAATKTIDMQDYEIVYVDIETGEELMRLPMIRHANPITVKGLTINNSWQKVSMESTSAGYALMDSTRKIFTHNAVGISSDTILNFFYLGATGAFKILGMSEDEVRKEGAALMEGYLGMIPIYTFDSTHVHDLRLNKVTLDSIDENVWKVPDNESWYLRVGLKDKNAHLFFETSRKVDSLPIGISFYNDQVTLLSDGDTLVFYDYNKTTQQKTQLGYIILEDVRLGEYSFNQNGFYGTLKIGKEGSPGITAQWGMQWTYDFYKKVFNRDSYDNAGGVIHQIVNPIPTGFYAGLPLNAFAIPFDTNWAAYYPGMVGVWKPLMVFGIGDNATCRPFVDIEILAHEFTHLVTAENGRDGFVYQGESGAIDESFADIFGFSVKNYVLGTTDYLIGTNCMMNGEVIRSMTNPKTGAYTAQPNTYQGEYWASTGSLYDNGGVHINNSIMSHWFYLLSEGGSGVNDNGDSYDVKPIGIEKAQQIAYRNLITYLLPRAKFADARKGSLQASADLYGEEESASVAAAWNAVGVYKSTNNVKNISFLNKKSSVRKVLQNGTIYIIRGTEMYRVDGQRVY